MGQDSGVNVKNKQETRIGLFASLTKQQNQLIDEHIELVHFVKEQAMHLKRPSGSGFYHIKEGYVKVDLLNATTTRTVRICGPEDILGFGLWHIFSNGSYQMTPLENGQAHFMTRESFLKLQAMIPEMSDILLGALCRIIISREQHIADLQSNSVISRVSSLLHSLGERFGKPTPQGILIDVKLDRKSLASLAGTSVESFSRILSSLEQDRIIYREQRSIYITNNKILRTL